MSGLSLELLEHGTSLEGSWLCTQVKQPAPEQQGHVLCFLGIWLALRSADLCSL